jgi:hypothetical protein
MKDSQLLSNQLSACMFIFVVQAWHYLSCFLEFDENIAWHFYWLLFLSKFKSEFILVIHPTLVWKQDTGNNTLFLGFRVLACYWFSTNHCLRANRGETWNGNAVKLGRVLLLTGINFTWLINSLCSSLTGSAHRTMWLKKIKYNKTVHHLIRTLLFPRINFLPHITLRFSCSRLPSWRHSHSYH